MTRPWDFRPENVGSAPPQSTNPDIDSPAFWYREAWYAGILFGLALWAVAAGVFTLGAWLESEWLLWLGGVIALSGAVPVFGGLASLLRQLIGERVLKRLVVAVVVLTILGCATFLILVATGILR